MPRGLIFDIDGTSIDSVDAHAHAWQQAPAVFGHPIAFPGLRRQVCADPAGRLRHFDRSVLAA